MAQELEYSSSEEGDQKGDDKGGAGGSGPTGEKPSSNQGFCFEGGVAAAAGTGVGGITLIAASSKGASK